MGVWVSGRVGVGGGLGLGLGGWVGWGGVGWGALDALSHGLAQHGLGLHAHALDAVDDDERAVGDAQSGGDLGREVNVAGRVCKPEGGATQALAA